MINPKFEAKLYLEGKTEEDLLKEFSQKTRYNIKLADRHGLKVRYSHNKKDLKIFYDIYKITTERDKIGFRPYEYFERMLEAYDKHQLRIYIVEYNKEPYKETGMLLKNLGYSTKELSQEGFQGISSKITDYKKLSEELGVGEITLKDIVKELEKPGRDPREDLPKPILRTDVLEMKDLKPGMKLKGTVRNVIDFGAFVDIGVHQDGLVHISQMADRFIKHPLEVVSVGDVVDVVVVSVDIEKKRIQCLHWNPVLPFHLPVLLLFFL